MARCTGLIGGFLVVAGETRLPLTVLEVGASAGLNLRFDRYRYASGGAGWGDVRSPVRFEDVFDGAAPPFDAPLSVTERRGCDASPLDPRSDEDRLTLMSYVWPDQTERFELLRAALEIAARDQIVDAMRSYGQPISPTRLAEVTGNTLGSVAYHVRTLLGAGVVTLAHTLKGSAAGIGAGRVAQSANAAEIAAGQSAAECSQAIDRLAQAVDEARALIAQLLREG